MSLPVAALSQTCHPEAIRQGWLKDLNVNTSDDGSSMAILCGGRQVAILTTP
jgi:hypothetical protein